MTAVPADLWAQVEQWLADDPDPVTRATLSALLADGDVAALLSAFGGALQFGTAGLRGRIGPGPNRMNVVTVRRLAAGLAEVLGTGTVVIGYDARHGSQRFACEAAGVLAGAGLRSLLLPRPLPTPVLAFAVRHLGCAAGIMVTASHNPASDNGLKVYLDDGIQIVPPVDERIAAAMAAVRRACDLPLAEPTEILGDDLVTAYLAAAGEVLRPGPRDLAIVTTALHGVGGDLLHRAFAAAGFPAPATVAEQFVPDPDFPTVRFPNPEEPGAIDRALALAEQQRADAVIAVDPDADRCAVAIAADQGYRRLTGDELGTLLGWWILHREGPDVSGRFATTIVSSRLLAKIAASAGVDCEETLTGFKWLARVPDLRYAYEEALGYCVAPWAVSDKDGVTAALLACEMLASLKAGGRTPQDALGELARRHGLHATRQWSLRTDDAAAFHAAVQRLRNQPATALGGSPVVAVTDFALGTAGLPATDAVRWNCADGSRVVVRPSGTEPKLKCYFEVIEEPAAASRAREHLDHLQQDVMALIAAR
jgi:phosphomannomutase